ncbi:MAG: NYN domain-containing protein [Ignavibacteriae bacterium]|nr:NYN domain-containing protein [Ignavibacteriota bacterium]
MKTVIIDGNNLMHKMPNLKSRLKDNPETARLSLTETVKSKIKKGEKVIFVFDGFGGMIKSKDIIFSGCKTADEIIRKYIEDNYRKNEIKVVSSDMEILRLAKVCGCEIMKSEDYISEIRIAGDKGKNINHLFINDSEKPDGMSKKDFEYFKNNFT